MPHNEAREQFIDLALSFLEASVLRPMKITTPDGVSLHIRQQGVGPEPILFVHGSFATSRWWMPASALLSPAAFTTYLVDLRGCGDSDRP